MSVAPGNYRPSASVGRGGANHRSDVLLVQQLVNGKLPIPLRPLIENGNCASETIGVVAA